MRTYFECIPCFLRQALEAVRLVTDDEAIQENVMRGVLRDVGEMDLRQSPPEMGQRIHRLIRKLTGKDDPYREVKDHFNRYALALYPELKERIGRSPDPLETAVRLAIAGNVIDFGPGSGLEDSQVHEAIDHSLSAPLAAAALRDFRDAVDRANDILYLGDNAGEIVFDRLLIEQMQRAKITFAVRGSPAINDATMLDAQTTGMTDIVEVIDNGTDIPGTVVEQCSEAFRRRFEDADLVIAKGQGNYETLSEVKTEHGAPSPEHRAQRKDIFFVLKAKCPVIAEDIGCEVGSLVLHRSAAQAR